MFGIQERFFAAWVENGGGSQNIDVVIEPSVKLRQHSVYCCKEHVNFLIFRVSRGQRVAELLCPIDDDTKNVSSLESAEIVREGPSCRTVIPVSTLRLSASSSISDHDVSVQVEVHNGDK